MISLFVTASNQLDVMGYAFPQSRGNAIIMHSLPVQYEKEVPDGGFIRV